MAYTTFKEIMIRYANENGGGLPLTPEEICNATVLWVQKHIEDYFNSNIKYDIVNTILYDNLIRGSETIVVDIAEDNKGLKVHLDNIILNDINKSVKIPMSTPSAPELPVLTPNGSISWEPTSTVGGGTKLYQHKVTCVGGGVYTYISFITTEKSIATGSSLSIYLANSLEAYVTETFMTTVAPKYKILSSSVAGADGVNVYIFKGGAIEQKFVSTATGFDDVVTEL